MERIPTMVNYGGEEGRDDYDDDCRDCACADPEWPEMDRVTDTRCTCECHEDYT